MILTQEEIQAVKNILTEEIENLEVIYLFGSGAMDHFTNLSDIDLAIGMKSEWSLDLQLTCLSRLENKLVRKVDLLNLYELDPGVKMEVIGKGKLLYAEYPSDYRTMESRALLEYLDLNDDRSEILKRIQNEGVVYG